MINLDDYYFIWILIHCISFHFSSVASNTGGIIGGIIAVLIVIIIAAVLFILYKRRQHRKRTKGQSASVLCTTC